MLCPECLKNVYLVRVNLNKEKTFVTDHTMTIKKVRTLGEIVPHESGLCRDCLHAKDPEALREFEMDIIRSRRNAA